MHPLHKCHHMSSTCQTIHRNFVIIYSLLSWGHHVSCHRRYYYAHCWELSLFYLRVGAMHGCLVAVCRVAGWVCLDETRVSVACVDVMCAVMFRLGASFFLPVELNRSLVVLPRISECGHGRWAKPSRSCFGLFIVNIIILYNLQQRQRCQLKMASCRRRLPTS